MPTSTKSYVRFILDSNLDIILTDYFNIESSNPYIWDSPPFKWIKKLFSFCTTLQISVQRSCIWHFSRVCFLFGLPPSSRIIFESWSLKLPIIVVELWNYFILLGISSYTLLFGGVCVYWPFYHFKCPSSSNYLV